MTKNKQQHSSNVYIQVLFHIGYQKYKFNGLIFI